MVVPLDYIDLKLQKAHALLQATHDYIKWQAPLDIKRMDSTQAFKVSSEAMRVTIRMTQIIGWLMLQKAVLEEELSRDEVLSEECRVLRGQHCLENTLADDTTLPSRLRELLQESCDFYLQVTRLDTISRIPLKKPMRRKTRRYPSHPFCQTVK